MCAQHRDRTPWNALHILGKNCTTCFQIMNHALVMNNLMQHIDRCTIQIQRLLDDFDGAYYAGTKPSGIGK